MTAADVLRLAAFGLAGLALGAASFAGLRLNTRLYLEGAVWRPLALQAARLALVVLALVLAVRQGALPLLAMGAGFVAARTAALRLARRPA